MDVIAAVKEVAGAVKKYNDVPLMSHIVELQAAVFESQQEKIELQRQLDAANQKLKTRETVDLRGHFAFRNGEPICAVCWFKDEKVIPLPPAEHWNGGERRDCIVCGQATWDKPMSHERPVVRTGTAWS